MKIFIYKTNQTFPFSELYKAISNFDKIFFSNGIDKFNSSQIRQLLPSNGLQDDDSVFVVPEKWQTEFYSLLENRFNRTDYDWQIHTPYQKPKKEEISDNWSDEIAEFYDSSELQVVEVLDLANKIKCIDENTNAKYKVIEAIKVTSQQEIEDTEDDEKEAIQKIDNKLRAISFSIATGIYKASKFISIFVAIIIFLLYLSIIGWNLKSADDLKFAQIPLMISKAEEAKQNNNLYLEGYWCNQAYYINVERTKKEVVELATKEVCKYFFEKIIENTDNQTEKNNITQGTDKTTDT